MSKPTSRSRCRSRCGNIDAYVVYVGFDPLGAAPQQKKKPAPKHRSKPAPEAEAESPAQSELK